jgi:hypothetical protein
LSSAVSSAYGGDKLSGSSQAGRCRTSLVHVDLGVRTRVSVIAARMISPSGLVATSVDRAAISPGLRASRFTRA